MNIPLGTPAGVPSIPVIMDVIADDISAVLGIDLLDREFLTPDTVANRLTKQIVVEDKDGFFRFMTKMGVLYSCCAHCSIDT